MQRLKQAIRRVAALGVGVAMLGATVTGAVAQAASLDLANLPQPFVSSAGVFSQDTALVVGSKADVSDVLGVGDVTAKLQFLAKTAVSSAGAVTVTGGVTEDIPIGLGIANSTSVAFDYSLDKTNINSFFKGSINFQNEDIDTHDEIVLLKASPSLQSSLTSADDDYESNMFLETSKGSIKYYYVFDDQINVTKSTAAQPLEVKFLGKTLKITNVDSTQTKFTATVGTEYFMKVGDVVTVEGKKVTLQNVGSSGAILVDVDGKVDTIAADSSKVVNAIEVKNDNTFYATSKSERSASLIIGKNAQDTFKDGDAYAGQNKNSPDWTWKVGNLGALASTTISSGESDPTGPFLGIQNDFIKDDNTDNPPGVGECYSLPNNYAQVCLDSLTVADTDYLTTTIEYQSSADTGKSKLGRAGSSTPTIYLHAPGDERFVIPATLRQVNSNGTVNANDIKTSEVWLAVAGTGTSGGTVGAVAREIDIFYRDNNENPNIKYLGALNISNASSGQFLRMNYLGTKDNNVRFNFSTGAAGNSEAPFTLGTSLANYTLHVWTRGDSSTELDAATDDLMMNFTVSNGNFSSLGVTASKEEAGELHWQKNGSTSYTQLGTKSVDLRTKYGIIVRDPKSNGASDKVVLEIPGDQVQANVVVKGSAATVSGGGVTFIPAKITVNTLKDTEVSDPTAFNLILVGGPCADPLVERVSALGVKCGEWPLAPGEAMLKLASNGGKVAMLIAGTDAADTRMATKVFSDFESYKLSGMQATLSGTVNSPTVKSTSGSSTTTTTTQ